MKDQIQFSVETDGEVMICVNIPSAANAEQVVAAFRSFMIAAGYDPDSVDEFLA